MIKATSLRCFPDIWDWEKCLEKAKEFGYYGIEINFDGDKGFTLDISPSELKEVKKEAKKKNIKIVSVYSRQQWKTPISSRDKEKREKGIKALKKLIDIAEFLEAPTILTIPGAVDNSILSEEVEILPYDEVYERVKEILSELSILAEKKGVILAVENVPNKFLLSPLEFKKFIEEINSKAVGVHFDVANCLYYYGVPEDWIRILGNYIKAVHIKDFKLSVGNISGFCNIFEGDINWKNVCAAFAEIEYGGAIISEVLPPVKFYNTASLKSISFSMEKIIKEIKKRKNNIVAPSDRKGLKKKIKDGKTQKRI